MAVVFCSLLVSACGGGSPFVSNPAAQQSHAVWPQANPTATPIPFTYKTIDDPNSSTNAVTGINELEKIAGVFGGGSASNVPESYEAVSPYTKFRNLDYPGAQGTYVTGLSSNKMSAGYVIDPPSESGIWAFVRVKSLWTLMEDSNEGTGDNAVTEILGINGSGYGVGFYVNNSGVNVPFEVDTTTETFTNLKVPGATGAEATGINGKSDIVGWATTSSGEHSFYLQAGTYYPLSYPGAQATYATSVNWQSQVAGYYVDGHGATRGFVLTGPTRGGAQQVWQTIDETNAAGGTWVTNINNHKYICGYYIDSSGVQHGFIGTP